MRMGPPPLPPPAPGKAAAAAGAGASNLEDAPHAADTTTTYGSLPLRSKDNECPRPSRLDGRNIGEGGGNGSSSSSSSSSGAAFTPSRTALTAALVVVIALGSANSLMYKIMFAAYGGSSAFFVSTGVNALYILYGGLILYPRMLLTDKVTPEMTRLPKTRFVIMGLLDSGGTFCAAMGAFYTPGQVQTLLNQTLIPVTMLASALYLRTRFSSVQLLGAALVLLGAISTTIATGPRQEQESRWYANLIFFLSNLPVACSQVYKEKSFKADKIDVIYLTQWVSIFQFGFGLLLAPLQAVPGVGSAHGVSMAQAAEAFGQGWRCFLERDPDCARRHTFALLTGYCAVNIVYNTAGLYVAKHGSAALNVLTYALLLPLTTLLFSYRPLLGPYTEPLRASTLVGLVVVVVGFYLYQRPVVAKEEAALRKKKEHRARAGGPGEEEGQPLIVRASAATGTRPTPIGVQVPSFQERVVSGLGPAIHVSLAASVSPSTAPATAEDEENAAGQRQRRPPWLKVI